MQRVFILSPINESSELTLSGETAKYLNSVLRVRRGDSLVLFDPDGEHFEAGVLSVSKGKVEVEITTALGKMSEQEGGLTLLVGLLKGSKMELVIQKAVELGVSAIVPLETRRTVVRETRKLDRWRKIALEAARQCGRPTPPPVEEPVSLEVLLESIDGPLSGVVFYEAPGLGPLVQDDLSSAPGQNTTVAVGPEGGFAPEEVELMAERGLIPRTLGGNILRAETAAIAAVTLAQYLTGRLGRPALDDGA
jgi:16S rRNA (uracil1498-N3)-methyltransferase